ncbi:MAG: hypothetical protein AAB859_00840, partial [Patescibacteria group bacterium]
ELGASTAKQTVKSVAQIVNPFSKNESKPHSPEVNRGKDHTPLDFKKLQNKFQDKDKLQAESLKNRLFQMVRREDEKIIERKDMEEGQKKRQEEYDEQEKKRKEQQQKNQNQESGMPTGKAKRGTMSRKKSSEQQHVENKPASGKQ